MHSVDIVNHLLPSCLFEITAISGYLIGIENALRQKSIRLQLFHKRNEALYRDIRLFRKPFNGEGNITLNGQDTPDDFCRNILIVEGHPLY